MSNHDHVNNMTLDEEYDYVLGRLGDMIAENEIADPQLSDGLKLLKKELDTAEPGAIERQSY